MSYIYPFAIRRLTSQPIACTPSEHTMGEALLPYISIKIHEAITSSAIKRIKVSGNYNQQEGLLIKEKAKQFNYKRPTISIHKDTATVHVFPGIDYVFHYACLIGTFLKIHERETTVSYALPADNTCLNALYNSNLQKIPKCNTIVMGHIEPFIEQHQKWMGIGDFLWCQIGRARNVMTLLGCKHSYWGDISGRIVKYLAQLGVKRVIYSGKLGTLAPHLPPNKFLATGNKSTFMDGTTIEWDNIFSKIKDKQIIRGNHATLPSTIQETTAWAQKNKQTIHFVDPEIGHMARAAQESNIAFSYLHIISDNIVTKHTHNLSNEWLAPIRKDRKILCHKILDILMHL